MSLRIYAIVVFVFLALISGHSLSPAISNGQTLDDIFAAWKVREEAVKTGEFEWEEKKHAKAGSVSGSALTGSPVPAQETDISIAHRLVFSGISAHYERSGDGFVNGALGSIEKRWSYHDGVGRVFTDPHREGYAFSGVVERGDSATLAAGKSLLSHLEYYPFNVVYRPFSWGMTTGPHFVLTGRAGRVGDDECVVIERRFGNPSDASEEWWLDRSHGFILRRKRLLRNDVEHDHMDISYRFDENNLPLADKWEFIRYDENGAVRSHAVFETTEGKLNVQVDLSQLMIEFPDRTLVTDTTTQSEYMVRSGGEERPVSTAELVSGMTIDDIMTTEPGAVAKRREGGGHQRMDDLDRWLRNRNRNRDHLAARDPDQESKLSIEVHSKVRCA